MTRPLQKLADELLSSEMDSYHEVVRTADAVMRAVLRRPPDSSCQICLCIYPRHTSDGCPVADYERAVKEWRRMNAAREAREKANE